MNAFDRLLSTSKIFLKKREEIPGYQNKLDQLVPAPKVFDVSFTPDQKEVYKQIAHFVENCTPLTKYESALDKIFYTDLSGVILSFLHPSHFPVDDRVLMMRGSAGTGKTFVISVLVARMYELLRDGEQIFVIAPTHKAKKIISKKIYSALKQIRGRYCPGFINYQTISRFLKQEPVYDKEGNSSFKTRVNYTELENMRYLIIDEASMVNSEDWDDLKYYVINHLPKLSVVIIGDEYQLPPVGEKHSPAMRDIKNQVNLTEIVRAKTACMVKLYKTFRGFVKKRAIKVPLSLEKKHCFQRTHRLHGYIKKYFDARKDKILSYSNNSVDAYNKLARKILFGEDADRYVDGDILIFRGIYRQIRPQFIFYTNDEVEVVDCEESKLSMNDTIDLFPLKLRGKLKEIFSGVVFKTYKITANFYTSLYTFNVIHEDDEARFRDYMRRARGKVKNAVRFTTGFTPSDVWGLFWDVRRHFNCPVKYSYALTIYKSQGSTYRHAFIDARNVANCIKRKSATQYTKTMYTAVTRASEKVFYADLLPIDEKIDLTETIQKDKELWPALKKRKLNAPDELKKDQVVRVTSKANTVKKRKLQILRFVECTKTGELLFTDDVSKFRFKPCKDVLCYT
jgi:predicted CoA-binding protein